MGTIYGNEYKDDLKDLFPEKTLNDFLRIQQEIRMTLLNFSLWRMERPWEVAPRRIDDTLLWIVREGAFRCTAGDASRVLRGGEGFAAPENTRHAMSFAPECERGAVCVIHLKLRTYPGASPFTALRTPFFRIGGPEGFFRAFERAVALKSVSREAAGKAVTAQVFDLMMDWAAQDLLVRDRSRPCDARVRAAMEFIHRNLAGDIGVSDIAAAAGLHEVRFRELFFRQTGMTPSACLKRARLDRVSELLIETLMPLSQIALLTGFNTPSYLCSVFRADCGKSPQAYRKLYQQRYRE